MASLGGRPAAAFALALVLAACAATPTISSATTRTPGPTATDDTLATEFAPATVPATPAGHPTSTSTFGPGSVVVTIVDGIRVRTRPEISAESARLEPLLQTGTRLFVVEGPVQESGYDWYYVAPVSLVKGAPPEGWVAKGSREGVPWLETGSVTCPAVPTTVSALLAPTRGLQLACFGRQSITVRGKFLNCECDIDGPLMNPSWFSVGEVRFLVDPSRSGHLGDPFESLWVFLDPDGTYPDPVPMGRVFEVTGMFDHPAAAACTTSSDGAPPEPTPSCRFDFAVTSIVAAG